MSPRVSPDGRRVAVAIGTNEKDVWVYDVERGSRIRLTSGGANSSLPAWSPDGSRVGFISNRSGNYDLYWVASDGSGQEEVLLARGGNQGMGSFSGDGKVLSVIDFTSGNADIAAFPLSGEPSPVLDSSFSEFNHDLSPDSRFIVYESDESGRYEIYVQSFPEPGAKWVVSKEGGRAPVWSDTGREIFFRNGSQMLVVDVDIQGELRVGAPRVLFDEEFRTDTVVGIRNYDASPDGSRFVMSEGVDETGGFELHVVVNWADELAARVASK